MIWYDNLRYDIWSLFCPLYRSRSGIVRRTTYGWWPCCFLDSACFRHGDPVIFLGYFLSSAIPAPLWHSCANFLLYVLLYCCCGFMGCWMFFFLLCAVLYYVQLLYRVGGLVDRFVGVSWVRGVFSLAFSPPAIPAPLWHIPAYKWYNIIR